MHYNHLLSHMYNVDEITIYEIITLFDEILYDFGDNKN